MQSQDIKLLFFFLILLELFDIMKVGNLITEQGDLF